MNKYIVRFLAFLALTSIGFAAEPANKVKVINHGTYWAAEVKGAMVPDTNGCHTVRFICMPEGLEQIEFTRSCGGDLCTDVLHPEDDGWQEWQDKFTALGLEFES